MNQLWFSSGCMLLIFALLGCNTAHHILPKAITNHAKSHESNISLLTERTWRLLSIKNEKITKEKESKWVTMAFERSEKKVRGFAGCNNYVARFSVDQNALKLNYIRMTRKACKTGMQLEAKFGDMVSKISSYQIKNGQLTLFDNEQTLIATLIEKL